MKLNETQAKTHKTHNKSKQNIEYSKKQTHYEQHLC